jgi:hypothetical protein
VGRSHRSETSLAIARQNVRWGIYDLVNDHQVNGTRAITASRARSSPQRRPERLELELDFDPSFERLVIHHVDVVRGNLRIDSLEPGEIRVIEKETTDNRIYDGERTRCCSSKTSAPATSSITRGRSKATTRC